MPEPKYSISSSAGILVIDFDAPVTVGAILEAIQEVAKLNDYSRRIWCLPESIELTAEDVKRIADLSRSTFTTTLRSAIVAPSDLAFGLFRVYIVYREDETVTQRLFRNFEDAFSWVNEEAASSLPAD